MKTLLKAVTRLPGGLHPLLVESLREEIALQNIGHVHTAHAGDTPEATLHPNQRAHCHLLHQTLRTLVIGRFRH